MAEWRTPVFDRTMDDVKSVDRTSAAYQKGALNADDLNRIEDNYKYLMAKLRSDAIFIPHRLRNFTETVLEYVEKENSILPDGYTQVEYIESSGTQYFNTGVIPTVNTRFVLDIEVLSYSGSNHVAVFGERNDTQTSNLFSLWIQNATTFRTDFGSNSGNTTLTTTSVIGRYIIDKNKNATTINGVTETNPTSTISTTYPIYLLSNNYNNTADSRMLVAKIYSCKIYESDTMIRNYIPCTNASGTVGLYDIVNDAFYENAGSGTFTAGSEVEPEITYELVETQTAYTEWQESNLPWLSEINRIRANHNALVRLFLVGLGLPVSMENNYLDYQEVNNWERIALTGKEMFENMEKEYRYCGMEDSGGDRLL